MAQTTGRFYSHLKKRQNFTDSAIRYLIIETSVDCQQTGELGCGKLTTSRLKEGAEATC